MMSMTQTTISFSSLPPSQISETVIVGWISGDEAKYMEQLKMNVVAETCTALLKKFLADPYVPKPKSCVFTAWHSQPFSRGSYSSIAVGGQQADIEKLAEPLFQRPMNRTVRKRREQSQRERDAP